MLRRGVGWVLSGRGELGCGEKFLSRDLEAEVNPLVFSVYGNVCLLGVPPA